ncbi:hypothetical protein HBH98_030520 [Parastagonospora nodorum]|nr:hypothetical protein HBH43_121080 [Parastagonospora nodorum]KAH4351523.1 hypothetical protein HBH98_030520 [Parastagonospora nodorum]KAH4395986.1 hypothetical protein HBH97_015100 [Parastagonospora nodorum]KAH4427073.1 hypothetical protein HBH99_019430 [Parastagonospora nodorum]KAH4908662.1 hypothetical protein HBI80_060480 [Parastagonospora nodorum]
MLCQGRPNSTSAALQSESTVRVLIQTARMCYCMPWPYTTAKIDDRRGLLSPHARAGRTNPEHSAVQLHAGRLLAPYHLHNLLLQRHRGLARPPVRPYIRD